MAPKMKTCDEYRDALIDVAAQGSEPSRELRAHLDVCAGCRLAFAEESQLFAAIDTGTRAVANAEVPVSFFPGVRGRFGEAMAPRHRWRGALILAAASAGIIATVWVALRPHAISSGTVQLSSRASTPPAEPPKAPGQVETAVNESRGTAAGVRPRGVWQREKAQDADQSAANTFEVIVPQEEHDGLARFISAQAARKDAHAVAIAVATAEKQDESMSLAPLQIAELKVRPLEALTGPDGSEDRE